jgi:hypothetical protein
VWFFRFKLAASANAVARARGGARAVPPSRCPSRARSCAFTTPTIFRSQKRLWGVSRRSSFFPTSRAHLASPLRSLLTEKQGQGKLGFAMAILFSPLLAVAGLSVQTLLRVIPQAAEGKDFFPKDSMDF